MELFDSADVQFEIETMFEEEKKLSQMRETLGSIKSIKQELQRKDNLINGFKKRFEHMESEKSLALLKASESSKLEEKIEAFQITLLDHESLIEQVKELTNHSNNLRAEIETLRNGRYEIQKKNDHLREQLDTAESQISEYLKQESELKEKIIDLENKLKGKENLEDQLANIKEHNEKLGLEITKLRKNLTEERSRSKQLQFQVVDFDQKFKIISDEDSKKSEKIIELKAVNSKLKSDISRLEGTNKNCKIENKEKIAKLTASLSEHDNQYTQLRLEYNNIKNINTKLSQKVQDLEEKLFTFQTDSTKEKQTEALLREEIRQNGMEIERLKSLVQLHDNAANSMKDRMHLMEDAHKQELSSLQKQIDSLIHHQEHYSRDTTTLCQSIQSMTNELAPVLSRSDNSIQESIDTRASLRALALTFNNTNPLLSIASQASNNTSNSNSHSSPTEMMKSPLSINLAMSHLIEKIEKLVEEVSKLRFESDVSKHDLRTAKDTVDEVVSKFQKLRSRCESILLEMDQSDKLVLSLTTQLAGIGCIGSDSVSFLVDSLSSKVVIEKNAKSGLRTSTAISPDRTGNSLTERFQRRLLLYSKLNTGIIEAIRIIEESRVTQQLLRQEQSNVMELQGQLVTQRKDAEVQMMELQASHEEELKKLWKQYNHQIEGVSESIRQAESAVKHAEEISDKRVLKVKQKCEAAVARVHQIVQEDRLAREKEKEGLCQLYDEVQEKLQNATLSLKCTSSYTLNLQKKEEELILQKSLLASLCGGYRQMRSELLLLANACRGMEVGQSPDRTPVELPSSQPTTMQGISMSLPSIRVVAILVLAVQRLLRIGKDTLKKRNTFQENLIRHPIVKVEKDIVKVTDKNNLLHQKHNDNLSRHQVEVDNDAAPSKRSWMGKWTDTWSPPKCSELIMATTLNQAAAIVLDSFRSKCQSQPTVEYHQPYKSNRNNSPLSLLFLIAKACPLGNPRKKAKDTKNLEATITPLSQTGRSSSRSNWVATRSKRVLWFEVPGTLDLFGFGSVSIIQKVIVQMTRRIKSLNREIHELKSALSLAEERRLADESLLRDASRALERQSNDLEQFRIRGKFSENILRNTVNTAPSATSGSHGTTSADRKKAAWEVVASSTADELRLRGRESSSQREQDLRRSIHTTGDMHHSSSSQQSPFQADVNGRNLTSDYAATTTKPGTREEVSREEERLRSEFNKVNDAGGQYVTSNNSKEESRIGAYRNRYATSKSIDFETLGIHSSSPPRHSRDSNDRYRSAAAEVSWWQERQAEAQEQLRKQRQYSAGTPHYSSDYLHSVLQYSPEELDIGTTYDNEHDVRNLLFSRLDPR